MPNLPHLQPDNTSNKEKYQPPRSGGSRFKLPTRNRAQHGKALREELKTITAATHADAEMNVVLQFESEPNFQLKLESLDARNKGIELLAVRHIENRELATVRVPRDNLQHFTKVVDDYLKLKTKTGKPKNQTLIDSVSHIHRAVLESFWTDDPAEWPTEDTTPVWWEVWLRPGDNVVEEFRAAATPFDGVEISDRSIVFPDRAVVLIRASKNTFADAVPLLEYVAEVRKPKELASFFMTMEPAEAGNWMQDLLARIQLPDGDVNAVCLLDTGVNRQHRLLESSLAANDLFTYQPAWGVHDHDGHGTQMAGLALFGDLVKPLSTTDQVTLKHRLESVKIIGPENDNPHELYGAITAECVARPEIESPDRKRVICLTVTTNDFRDRGRPSSWSAEIDSMAVGVNNGRKRLFVISAGNVRREDWIHYPDSNETELIHDPGQAWNALTVGSCTEKIQVDDPDFEGWTPIASPGDMSPCHSTSLTWQAAWPIKPDVVMEGGNALRSPDNQIDQADSLLLLTTHHQPLLRPFTTTGETSAAAAQVSRLAAQIQAEYPNLWPETIRALIVHSADWTKSMLERFTDPQPRARAKKIVRCYGYGVPDSTRAIWSANDALTMIIEGELQPYTRKNAGAYSLNEMDIHGLPWPTEVLEELGEVEVEMRVTLSYFIEPSPGSRGWKNRYRYASHGLRFDVKTPEETVQSFRQRLNKAARDEEEGRHVTASDSEEWTLGPNLRSLGSIHSDRWQGTAVALAQRANIGVFPVGGWWRDRHHLGRWNRSAPYALVVSIAAPGSEVDIYTPVAAQIQIPNIIAT